MGLGCVFLWFFNFLFESNANEHLWHLNGKWLNKRSSVCDFLCTKKSLIRSNCSPQYLHLQNEVFKYVSVFEYSIEFELKQKWIINSNTNVCKLILCSLILDCLLKYSNKSILNLIFIIQYYSKYFKKYVWISFWIYFFIILILYFNTFSKENIHNLQNVKYIYV